jgi:N-acetylneuraminic acid mutarotase
VFIWFENCNHMAHPARVMKLLIDTIGYRVILPQIAKRRGLAAVVAAALIVIGPGRLVAQSGWTAAAPMPLARSELNAAVAENRLYVAGGIAQLGATAALQVYDPATDSWRSLAPMPEPRHHFGIAALDGRIYVSGGYRDLPFGADTARAEVWAYDISADAWSGVADLPAPRAAHVMVALDGRLYVVGGVGAEPATVFAYDPKLERWTGLSTPLPTLREHLAAVALDGRIYVIGGRWGSQGNLATVEILDPAAGTWSAGADMPTRRGGLTASVLDGRIHVAGGEDLNTGDTYAAHEVYDPAGNQWTTEAPMPTARHGLASGVIDGRWYVVGGGEHAGAMTFLSLSDVVEVFRP